MFHNLINVFSEGRVQRSAGTYLQKPHVRKHIQHHTQAQTQKHTHAHGDEMDAKQ